MPIYNGSTQITTIKRPSYQETSWVNATTAEIQSAVSSGKITTYTAGDGVYTYTAYKIVDTANWRLISQATYQQAVVIQTKKTFTKNEIITWKVGSKYTYCKRTFTVKKWMVAWVDGVNYTCYCSVSINEPLPFDIYFSIIWKKHFPTHGTYSGSFIIKAGEIYGETYTLFAGPGLWVPPGFSVIIDIYNNDYYPNQTISNESAEHAKEHSFTLY